jgi:hypothetical protein
MKKKIELSARLEWVPDEIKVDGHVTDLDKVMLMEQYLRTHDVKETINKGFESYLQTLFKLNISDEHF